MAKSANLVCPDCNLEAVLHDGQRMCPACREELLVDADTFEGAPKAQWTYLQRRGESRGSLR